MKSVLRILTLIIIIAVLLLPVASLAMQENDNGIMKIYPVLEKGFEFEKLKGFDIKGYVQADETTNEKVLVGSTFENYGYHTFLNVNGINGNMDSPLVVDLEALDSLDPDNDYTDEEILQIAGYDKILAMQYTEVEGIGWQNIDGIDLRVSTQFINEGDQVQIIYDLKNTTNERATISLATAADVSIDGDDKATIERLEDGSGVKLWTNEGKSGKPVQFVFYGKNVPGTTAVDNLWIGEWDDGKHFINMFNDNSSVGKLEKTDSSFAYSWVNRIIEAGEEQKYTVLMQIGDIKKPNTGIFIDENKKFYYKDVRINGVITDDDLKDTVTIHYIVDGEEYSLAPISTNGSSENFVIDLTPLNLEPNSSHTIKVWATDSTNSNSNEEEKTFVIYRLYDPEIKLSTKEWAKSVSFKIIDSKNDKSVVDTYQYRFNSGTWVDCSKDTDIPVEGNGIVKIEVRIKGIDTNDFSSIVTDNAKIDNKKPSTTKPDAVATTNSITVTFKQTDSESGIDDTKTMYAIKKNGTWSDWQSEKTFTGLNIDTEYAIKTKTEDKVGNSSESEELTIKTSKETPKTEKDQQTADKEQQIIGKKQTTTEEKTQVIEKDTTTATGKLPQTGQISIISKVSLLGSILGLLLIAYKKIRMNNDIK